MNEIDCYKTLYGMLVYDVRHYHKRIGWVQIARSNAGDIMQNFIDGNLVPNCTISAWVKK